MSSHKTSAPMITDRIPFNRPSIVGNELEYISECVLKGHTSGDGVFTRRCQALLEQRFTASKVLLTTSCTSALEMAALLCDIDHTSEVILPSYTFVSTANAFLMRGARLRFVDICEDTLNMDVTQIEGVLTADSRAIVPVHYAGIGCDMDEVNQIAKRHGLDVIEDAAQGVNSTYKGAPLGTIGRLGTFSFHETKNFICGEGGALVINDEALIERAEIILEKGTNRSQFFRGEVDKYTWVELGSSFLPSDILAAFLYAQLEEMDSITRQRRHAYSLYLDLLSPLADRGILRLPIIPEGCASNYHMFFIITDSPKTQKSLLKHLNNRGINAVFHYVPLHSSPMGVSLGYRKGMLPVTEDLSARLIRLPFYFELSDEDIYRIAGEVKSYFDGT